MHEETQKLRAAFDAVHASEQLKSRTRAKVSRRTFHYGENTQRMRAAKRKIAAGIACLLLVCGVLTANFLPVSVIDIDVNPSLELRCNVFGRVIRAVGRNRDGDVLAQVLDIDGKHYSDAMRRIFISNELAPYLEGECMVTITVVGRSQKSNEKILKNALCNANRVAQENNLYYCQVDSDLAREARSVGLSPIRYIALVELQKTDPDITPEDVAGMSMAMLWELTGYEIIENPCGEGT